MNEYGTAGYVVLQPPPLREVPTVAKSLTPPVLKPVASDITMRNCLVAATAICVCSVPLPLLYAESGIVIFRGVPNTWV